MISVITTVRNGEKNLQRAINSVASQNISNLEYIIVDGASTDGTIDIICANSEKVSYWKSEKDDGISDGLNKGVALSTGQFIALVHADDWLSPGQIRRGIESLEAAEADFVFGDLIYYRGETVSHRIRGDARYRARLAHIMPDINHPTVIVRRSAYEIAGLFNTDYKYAMDYELFLRLEQFGMKGVYNPLLVSNMSLDGASDRYSHRALSEVRRASIAYGYPAFIAWARFLFRILKGDIRRLAQKLLPASWYQAARSRANPNYMRQ